MCVCVSEVVFLLRFTFFFLLPFIESSAILLTCAVGFLSSFSFFFNGSFSSALDADFLLL